MAKTVKEARWNWRKSQFWRNMFLYFWCFSFLGHLLEIPWALLGNAVGFRATPASTIPLFAVAVPYGLAAVALLLTLYPLVKKKKLNSFTIFVLSTLLTTVLEFICAAVLVAVTGHLPFWNYSERFMNLFGFVCLGNSLMFGVGSTVALKFVFPFTEKVLVKVKESHLNIAFWVLFVGYILAQIPRFF